MQKITPHLWFDDKAEEAVRFYADTFGESEVMEIRPYPDSVPDMAGKVLNAHFSLQGTKFMALDGGPMYKPTPALSFFVTCTEVSEVDRLHDTLSDGGYVAMALDTYPWSERYAWVGDRYGFNWQIMKAQPGQEDRPRITPSLLFVDEQDGRAQEAMDLYTGLFEDSGVVDVQHHPAGAPVKEGHVMFGLFRLHGQEMVAMDGGQEHGYTFTEATSLYVECEDQAEVDHLWDALSEDGEIQQCGWLKDRFGVSWQIIPRALPRLMNDPDPDKAGRVMQAMLQMKKIDVAALEEAQGET